MTFLVSELWDAGLQSCGILETGQNLWNSLLHVTDIICFLCHSLTPTHPALVKTMFTTSSLPFCIWFPLALHTHLKAGPQSQYPPRACYHSVNYPAKAWHLVQHSPPLTSRLTLRLLECHSSSAFLCWGCTHPAVQRTPAPFFSWSCLCKSACWSPSIWLLSHEEASVWVECRRGSLPPQPFALTLCVSV